MKFKINDRIVISIQAGTFKEYEVFQLEPSEWISKPRDERTAWNASVGLTGKVIGAQNAGQVFTVIWDKQIFNRSICWKNQLGQDELGPFVSTIHECYLSLDVAATRDNKLIELGI